MQGEKQLRIAKYFGEANQILKAHEELEEIKEALEDYCNNQNIDTLKHTLNEVYDLANVLEGIYRLMGGSLEEIASDKEYKLCKTISIINKIPTGTKEEDRLTEYEKIRRG